MNRHRDNICENDIIRVLKGDTLGNDGHPTAGAENSQIIGSNVIVFTFGSKPQLFYLRHPAKDDYTQSREMYRIHPLFQFPCGDGTVSVLDPVDDLLLTHEVFFKFDDKEEPRNVYRFGLAFRWLQSARDFYVDTCGMRLDKKALAKEARDAKRGPAARSDELFPEFVKDIRT